MKQLQLLIILLATRILPTSAQGLYGTAYRTAWFVTSPNTRVTAPIRRSLTVTESLSCTSACIADNYCLGYNLRVMSSSGVLLCELLSDVVNTTFAVDSALTTFQIISDPFEPDYVSMPQTAFSVYIDQAAFARTVVSFNNIPVNIGAVFDPVTNMFVVPRYGLYWQHIHTRTDANTMCDFSLVSTGGLPRIGVIRDYPLSTTGKFDTLSRDDIRWLPTRTQIYVTSPNNDIADPTVTTVFLRAAWSAFKLDEFMSPLVAFNVYQDSTITTPSSQSQPVPFNNVVVNEGGGWNVTSYKFVAPVSGIYVFSFGTAGLTGSAPIFKFVTSTGYVYDASYQTNSTTTKIHMSHRTVITNLTQGQSAWVSGLGSQSFGNVYQLASFKGFLYSPPQGVKVVWWACRTSPGNADPSSDLFIGNVPFNIGNAWSTTQAIIPASAAGIYYIMYSGMTLLNTGVQVDLYINNNLVSTVAVDTNADLSIYREGAHMAPLASGTTVSIRVVTGPFEPDLPIGNVPINIGNAWSDTQASIPASAPGIYYIVYGAVTIPNSAVNVQLFLNGNLAASAVVNADAATSIYREGAHMASLASGNTESVRVVSGNYAAGTGFCCTLNRHKSNLLNYDDSGVFCSLL